MSDSSASMLLFTHNRIILSRYPVFYCKKMELQINSELKSLIPKLTNDEFNQLEKNILEEGIRDPLCLWNGVIIDGHNRYEIAQIYELEFQTIEMEFPHIDDVKLWMAFNQKGRRNLTKAALIELGLSVVAPILEKRAKENLSKAGKEFGKGMEQPCTNSDNPIKPINTIQEVANFAEVGRNTVAEYKKILDKAPEKKQELIEGKITIHKAYSNVKKKERKIEIEEQRTQIEKENFSDLIGLYDVISIDPPWPYGRAYDPDGSRVSNPYPEMSIEQIKAVELPVKEDSIIWLWTTHAFLKDAFDIMEHWGFDYKATLVWNKEKMGLGSWLRMQCEFCIIGIKGKPFYHNTTERDIISEPRREHSRKPDNFFTLVERVCAGKKLEYFSREKREGWDVFGNDTNKF